MSYTFKKPTDCKHDLWAIKMPTSWSSWQCMGCAGGIHGTNACGEYPCPVFATATRIGEIEEGGSGHPVPEGWLGRTFGICKDAKGVGI